MVLHMSNGTASKGLEASRTSNTKKGALLNVIRNVLPEIQGEFTQHTVIEKLREKNPGVAVKRASLSSTLRRLADDKEIELLELGAGKRPTRYKVIDTVQI